MLWRALFLSIVGAVLASSDLRAVPMHEWSQRFGDGLDQNGPAAAADGSGNLVVAGSFRGNVDFGGGPLTSAGDWDVYVARLSEKGGHLWSRRFGDADYQVGRSVAVDGSGNVVVAGGFRSTLDFGRGPLTSAGSDDFFVAKFDAGGNHLWSRSFGDAGYQTSISVVFDNSGNVVLSGAFFGTVDFGGGPLTSAGSVDICIAKLDANGGHLWSKRFGDSQSQWAVLAVDGSNDIVATGAFEGTLDFGGGPLTSAGSDDIFLAKFDTDGSHLWSKRFGGPDYQGGWSVEADGSEGIVLSGVLWSSVDFGGGLLTSAGDDDVFVARFDADGNHVWSKRFGGPDHQRGRSALDGAGNIIAYGWNDGSIDFGDGPLASAGDWDTYLAKLDSDGNHLWSQSFGGTGNQLGTSVAVVGGSEDFFVTGEFGNTVDFGNGPLTSAGGSDIFIAKFMEEGPVPILLSGFSAEPRERGVLLSWHTSFEYLHDGFNLYRSLSLSSGYALVNDRLIRGRSPYSYSDSAVRPSTTYYYKVGAVALAGDEELFAPVSVTTAAWGIRAALSPAAPNPFSTGTTVAFSLPAERTVRVAVYDVAGRLVSTILDDELPAGEHAATWNGRDHQDHRVVGGTYFVRLHAGEEVRTRRVVFLGE